MHAVNSIDQVLGIWHAKGTEKRNTKTEISQGIEREINLMRSVGLKTSIRVFIVMVAHALIQLSLCETIECMFPYDTVTVCTHTVVRRLCTNMYVPLLYLLSYSIFLALFLSQHAKNAFSRFH